MNRSIHSKLLASALSGLLMGPAVLAGGFALLSPSLAEAGELQTVVRAAEEVR